MENIIHVIEVKPNEYGVALNENSLEFSTNVLEASKTIERLITENNLKPTDKIEIEEIEWGEDKTTVAQWQEDTAINAECK